MKYFLLLLVSMSDIIIMFGTVTILLLSLKFPIVFWGTVVFSSIIFILIDKVRDKIKAIYQ